MTDKELKPHYSQGVCSDGAAILKDGVRMTVDEIVAELNSRPAPNTDQVVEAQLSAILSFIDEGYDELTVRRIWERVLRAGQKALATTKPSEKDAEIKALRGALDWLLKDYKYIAAFAETECFSPIDVGLSANYKERIKRAEQALKERGE